MDRIDANLKAAEADRLNSDIKFQAMEKRMDANQAKSDIKFQAMEKRLDDKQRQLEDKIEASATSVKLWVIITFITVVATGIAILKAFGGI